MDSNEAYKQEMKRLLEQSKLIRKYTEELKKDLKAIDRETELFNNVKLVRRAEKIANGGEYEKNS